MPCSRTKYQNNHRNNVPTLRGKKHYISLKILHQEGFETTRKAATIIAKRHALTIRLRLSLPRRACYRQNNYPNRPHERVDLPLFEVANTPF